MRNFFVMLALGVGLFLSGSWYLGLFDAKPIIGPDGDLNDQKPQAAKREDLGEALYTPAKYKPIELPKRRGNPVIISGVMNAFETEEVPSSVPGTILFIGDQVDDGALMAAGSTAFLAEPYYFAEVDTGRRKFKKFYRRHYEGDTITQGQMLGMIKPAQALAEVIKEITKIQAAKAEHEAALASEGEGLNRFLRQDRLLKKGATNEEEWGAARLTWTKLKQERVVAEHKIKIAEVDKDKADTVLNEHEIRAVMPYRTMTIKSIQRAAGTYLKQLDPVVMTVQSLERLMAEAQIEQQYAVRLKNRKDVTATIEPTIKEAPSHEYTGHDRDVNCIAVSRDMRIVSGSEDGAVYVWTRDADAPQRHLDHDPDPVKAIICSSAGAKENYCLVGCASGDLHLWDLDKETAEPIKRAKHGDKTAITSLAFSPDGKHFATGGADGSIKIWATENLVEKYAFVPQHGVDKCHDDAVTSLTFTPQCKLISASRDNSLRVWDLYAKGAAPAGRPLVNRKGLVGQLGVSRDGQWMLFDQGSTLKMLSVEKKNLVHTVALPVGATPFDTLAQFSPDGSLLLTAGASEGRLQLWRTPDAQSRGYELRQLAPRDTAPVACAAFSNEAGKGGPNSFAVSASGNRVYVWAIPTPDEIDDHRVENVRLTLKTHSIDTSTGNTRIGFEVPNPATAQYPQGRFEAGRPVTIVID